MSNALGKIMLAAFLSGCPLLKTTPPPSPEISAEIASQAAYAIVRSRKTFAPSPPAACCSKCTNGKVRSGDGIAWVSCPCPQTCKCKAAKQ
jgi:hypothetical protein